MDHKKMRNYAVDTIRFVAIIFVIVIHVRPYFDSLFGPILNQIARFAVPYFFIVAGYYFYRKCEKAGSNPVLTMIAYGVRLSYIYFFWFLLYAFWPLYEPNNWSNIAINGFSSEFLNWWSEFYNEFLGHVAYTLLAGGKYGIHLWFLPSLGMGIFILSIFLKLNAVRVGLLFSVALFVFALLLAPYKQSFIGISAIDLGVRNGPFFSTVFVFIGAYLAQHNITSSNRAATLMTLFGLILSLIEVMLIKQYYNVPIHSHDFVIGTIPYGLGIALFALSNANFGSKIYLYKIGRNTLGLYAIHVMIIYLLGASEIWPSNDSLKILYVLIASIILVELLSRVPFLSRVIK